MNFRILKTAIIEILSAAEAGRYRTIDSQRQSTAASEVVNNLRTVQVYYENGQFRESSGRMIGSVMHEITFNIDLKVSSPASVDLSVLNNITSTPVQRAAALVALQESSAKADEIFDELVDIIFQVLMDARNYDLGLEKGIISNRWIPNIQKNEPLPQGELVVLTGSMPFTCRTIEYITGEDPSPADTIDTTLVVDDDEDTKAGKTVINNS
jgi:hypothetical protein